MRYSRLILAGIGAALAALILSATIFTLYRGHEAREVPSVPGIGGAFALVDHHGKSVTERDYLGKPTLVFFGFTFCPDVCPTALLELSNLLKGLGPAADRLNVLFITVDPDRDTPQQLALYLSSFDPRITGLTGASENIAAAIKGYRVYARKVPLDGGGYTMDHTATIYMMNSMGQFVDVMAYQEPDARARDKLQRLLGSNRSFGAHQQ
jgi:protein SCO1